MSESKTDWAEIVRLLVIGAIVIGLLAFMPVLIYVASIADKPCVKQTK